MTTMKNFLLCILLCSVLFIAVFPTTPATAATQFGLFPTYRQDNFVWNKAGLNDFPNIISELKWENLRSQGVKGVLKHDMGKRHFLEASGGWGWIYSGANQDSDYDVFLVKRNSEKNRAKIRNSPFGNPKKIAGHFCLMRACFMR